MKIKRPSSNAVVALTVFLFIGTLCYATTALDHTKNNEGIMIPIWLFGYSIILIAAFNGLLVSRTVADIVFASWLIRIVCIILDMATGFTKAPDQIFFLQYGRDIFLGTRAYVIEKQPYVIAMEYRVFGISPFLVRLTNVFFSMLGLALLMKSMQEMEIGKRTYTWIATIGALSPFTILFSVTALREAIYYFAIALSMFFFVKWIKDGRNRSIILSAASLLPAIYLHNGYILIVGGYCIIYMRSREGRLKSRLLSKFILMFLGVMVAAYILRTGLGGYFDGISTKGFSEAFEGIKYYIRTSNGKNALGKSSYLEWTIDIKAPLQMFLYTPLRVIYLFLSPMIWDVRGPIDLMVVFADSSLFLLGGLALLKGIDTRKYNAADYALLWSGVLVVLCVALPFGWGTVTSGTALRHRNSLLPWVLLMMAVGFDDKTRYKTKGRSRYV